MDAKLVKVVNAHSANDTRAMLADYLSLLTSTLSAYKCAWYAAYKGEYGRQLWQTQLMYDWKVVDVVYAPGFERDFVAGAKAYFEEARKHGDVDPQVRFCVEHAGRTRIQRIHEAISPQAWNSHWMRDVLLADGVGERMIGVFTLSSVSESIFLIDRHPGDKSFDENDVETFNQALVSFPRLHYWLFLERGLVQPAKRPFSPREREVVQLLLGPKSEVEIAETLELSKGTVHNYIRDIYKNLNVSSRYQLVQLWLQDVPSSE